MFRAGLFAYDWLEGAFTFKAWESDERLAPQRQVHFVDKIIWNFISQQLPSTDQSQNGGSSLL